MKLRIDCRTWDLAAPEFVVSRSLGWFANTKYVPKAMAVAMRNERSDVTCTSSRTELLGEDERDIESQ